MSQDTSQDLTGRKIVEYRGMINTHMYFPQDLYAELSFLAEEEDKSVAQLVRELVASCVKDKLNKAKKKVKKRSPLDWLKSLQVEGPEASVNHNRYIYDEK